VRIPLRHLSSFEHPTTNSTSKIDCLQANIKNEKLKTSSFEIQQTIKSEFRNNHCAMETTILHFNTENLIIKPEMTSNKIELYNSINELYKSGFNKDKRFKLKGDCVDSDFGEMKRTSNLNGFSVLSEKKNK